MPPVAVFDTNILLSALLWPRGRPLECLVLARDGRVRSATCDEILREFSEKLVAKFGYDPAEADRAAAEVRRLSTMVVITGTMRLVPADPADDKVLECAVAGDATHVVTGDRRHLLPMRAFQSVSIVTAAEFVRFVNSPA